MLSVSPWRSISETGLARVSSLVTSTQSHWQAHPLQPMHEPGPRFRVYKQKIQTGRHHATVHPSASSLGCRSVTTRYPPLTF